MAAKVIKKRIKRKPCLAGPRYWVAVGTLAAYSATGGSRNALAQNRTAPMDKAHGTQLQALPVRRYDVAPGPLRVVLQGFERVSGIKVSATDDGVFTIQSPGVSGVYTTEQALKVLLANIGLDYSFNPDGSAVLSLKQATNTIDVQASAPVISSSMPKYQGPLIDTPQTIRVVPQEVLEQQGVTTLRDALRNVAGISLAAGEGGSQGDNLTIRGFTARNDLFIDGMRDFGSYYRDPFNTNEVEVLQGPSSVTFGRGSTGGIVNQANKTPDLNRFISSDLAFGTDATRRATIDLNMPVPALGSGAAFRLNVMGDIGGVAGRDVTENRRLGFAPSLALGLETPTRLTFSYFHQNADDIPDYGIPWMFNGPAPVPHNNYYGLEDGNFLRTYDDIGTIKIEHDFNENVTIRDQARYAHYVRDALITEPQLLGLTLSTPLDEATVTRHEIGVNSAETFLDNQLDVIAHFETGSVRHTLVAGVEGGRETSDPTRPNFTAPQTSLLNPDPSDQLNPEVTISSQVSDSALSAGVYAVDTVSIGKKWEFTGGLRYDRFDNTFTQAVAPVAHFERVDQKPTWRAAAVYKPVSFGSLYFDAGTSFNPSAETLALSAGTANLPPESNKTYEFGSKWSLLKNRLNVNGSWFRTEKENAREASPTNSLLYVLAGKQRVSGFETDVRGHLTSRWDMLASYAYLDSRVVSSQFYPGAIGYPLANVPKNTFAFWNNYQAPHHFDFGLGTNYESSRNASSTVPLDPTTGLVKQVPGYWVFNAMASHPLGEHIDVQVNVYNLANRYYYDELHPGHIVLGPGRSALIDLKFKF
ncbi:MAG TPA: TonB-dependent siderophore receptor [Bryobacteraceae bacterium]|jgi:catecholate siderophore receptor|nr:TonB-dependent siderophore receptor [Bryobacteraceae bacterium]